MVALILGATSLLLVGNTIFPTVSAQTSGNATNNLDQVIQSKIKSNPQELPVQPGSNVFVVICPSSGGNCQPYDLVPLRPAP